MIKVIFNGGKRQRWHYYWIANADIESGEYKRVFQPFFEKSEISKVQEFKNCLILTANKPLDVDILDMYLPKAKSKYKLSDVLYKLQIFKEFKI